MIISGSFLKIQTDKELLKKFASSMHHIHFDVMDGKFTEKATLPLKKIDFGNVKKIIDVHLMVYDIKKYTDEIIRFNPKFITFHIEIGNTLKHINYVKSKGIKVGLAINPSTDINLIYPFLDKVDLVLIMSVEAGAGGQTFIDISDRVDKLKKYRGETKLKFLIEVDGGINDKTIHKIKGADICVVGSFITDGNFDERLKIIEGEIE